jgi:hypothetical protein
LDESFARSLGFLRRNPSSSLALREALNIIDWAERREQAALESTAALLPRDRELGQRLLGRRDEIRQQAISLRQSLTEHLEGTAGGKRKAAPPPAPAGPSPDEIAAARLIPVRNPSFPGPVSEDYLASTGEVLDPAWRRTLSEFHLYEIGAFIDGKRNVLDIRNAVSAECGPTSLAVIVRYLEDLEQAGLVTFRPRVH